MDGAGQRLEDLQGLPVCDFQLLGKPAQREGARDVGVVAPDRGGHVDDDGLVARNGPVTGAGWKGKACAVTALGRVHEGGLGGGGAAK